MKYQNPLPFRTHKAGDAMPCERLDELELELGTGIELVADRVDWRHSSFKWRHAMAKDGWIKWDGRDDKSVLEGVHFEREYTGGTTSSSKGSEWAEWDSLKAIRVPVVEDTKADEVETVKDNPKHSIPTRTEWERQRRIDLLEALLHAERNSGSAQDIERWRLEYGDLCCREWSE